MSVIEKVLKLMEQNHISAKKLTTDLGLANSSISEWKKGKARPSLEAVIKIAGYFGVTTDFLLLDQEPIPEAASLKRTGLTHGRRLTRRADGLRSEKLCKSAGSRNRRNGKKPKRYRPPGAFPAAGGAVTGSI